MYVKFRGETHEGEVFKEDTMLEVLPANGDYVAWNETEIYRVISRMWAVPHGVVIGIIPVKLTDMEQQLNREWGHWLP